MKTNNKIMKINKIAIAALMGAAAWTTAAGADDFQSYTADWSGATFDNGATAVATFDLDVTAMEATLGNNTGGYYAGGLDGYISDLSLTVTGASSGNGTFTTSDFGSFTIETDGPMDFSSDLAPQSNLGDFNFFGSSPAPDGTTRETLSSDGGDGEDIQLMSITPAPEPSTLALAGLGTVAGLIFLGRRK